LLPNESLRVDGLLLGVTLVHTPNGPLVPLELLAEVDVRKEVPPLFAVAAFSGSTPRSRPGSDLGHRTLIHGVSVGGLEELMELLAAGAA
jgi:hypothetical protein